ncbi:MAG: acyl-CoA dehydrogenase family protein, partial [Pseudonocardiaceae bacterium]
MAPDPYEMVQFRAAARAWLADHVKPYRVDFDADTASLVFADVTDLGHLQRGKAWQRTLVEGGWAGLGWPVKHGGRGASMALRVIWAEEMTAAGAPPGINLIGEAMVGPTLIDHGSPEQQRRFLKPLLSGEEIWCQLFSEPEAGSDIAAVRTAAVRRGDCWIVDGHKVWTSGAHY